MHNVIKIKITTKKIEILIRNTEFVSLRWMIINKNPPVFKNRKQTNVKTYKVSIPRPI